MHFVSCMQMTSGCTESSQRMTCGRRARIEFTFQVATNILNRHRHQETADECAATADVVGFNVFVYSVCAIPADAQTIEHRNTHRSQKISIRRTADLRLTEIEIEIGSNRARLFKQLNDCRSTFHRWPVDAPGDKHFRPFVNRFETGKYALDLLRLCFSGKAHVDLALRFGSDDIRSRASTHDANI